LALWLALLLLALFRQKRKKPKPLTGNGFLSRGDKTPLELFIVGVRDWSPLIQSLLSHEDEPV